MHARRFRAYLPWEYRNVSRSFCHCALSTHARNARLVCRYRVALGALSSRTGTALRSFIFLFAILREGTAVASLIGIFYVLGVRS
ncbi:hypothetical protein OE88DRAFT_1631777 [Heliocybe sulcata]|uniref:Uncharacterized protein n=1 Tax=Heliocybe sulcata TaxID=5364 RepID=A0A5C3N1H1_9AGAM|nr:hypothetical protein OE88DRAFT_1631777 [Heliocybe sulcata]